MTGTVQTPAAPAAPAAPVATPAPGTPEHDAAMAAKFDGQQSAAAPAAPARPAWLPEKFKTPEDMAKAYGELESKLGAPKPGTPEPKPGTPPADDKGDLTIKPDQKAAEDAVKSAGLDFNALSTEFAEHGDLKPESYTALEKAGIPKPMVDAYIAGQKAIAATLEAKVTTAAHEAAGGAEQYTSMVTWAKTGLTAAQQDAYNKAVTTGNPDTVALAVAGLRANYERANGTQGELISGSSNNSGDAPYASMAQAVADMKKPEYKKDPAFREKVARRLDASNVGAVITRS